MGLFLICLTVEFGAEPLLALWLLPRGGASPAPRQTLRHQRLASHVSVRSALYAPLDDPGLAHERWTGMSLRAVSLRVVKPCRVRAVVTARYDSPRWRAFQI